MGTFVLAKIPDSYVTSSIAANELPLVGMNNNIIDRSSVGIVALHIAGSRIPDLHGAIFRAGHHPLALAVKCNAGDVVSVTLKSEDGRWIRGLNVIKFDGMVTRGGKVAFVR